MQFKLNMLLVLCAVFCLSAVLTGCGKETEPLPSASASESAEAAPESSAEASEFLEAASGEQTDEQPDKPSAAVSSETPQEPSEPVYDKTDIFSPYREKAASMAAQMGTEEKVWQLFLAAVPKGADPGEFAQSHPAGGYLLFRWDFEGLDADGVRQKMESLSDGEVQPLLAVDEEGGEIVRVSWYKALREERFKAPSALWAEGGADAVYGDALEKGQFLAGLGINLCLAPVADVSENPKDYIYSRTIGRDAQETCWYVSAVVKGLQDGGVGSTLKHFPGYGNNANTHTGIAVDERPLDEFESADLKPFAAGIGAGCGSVLVSHNIVNAFDKERPASLSPAVHRFLREEMGFAGLIMTDDLVMDGVRKYSGGEAASVAALKAGNDLLIHSDAESGVRDILAALEDGSLDMALVDRAAEQVLCYKLWLGIIEG